MAAYRARGDLAIPLDTQMPGGVVDRLKVVISIDAMMHAVQRARYVTGALPRRPQGHR